MAKSTPQVDASILEPYIADGGLPENGTVPIYMTEGADEEKDGGMYDLRSISWRLLEDIGVGIAAYNTPKTLHSLAPNLQMETFMVLEHAKRDPRVKALVWTSTGTKAFSSGAALKGDRTVHVPKEVVAAYLQRGMAPSSDLVLANQTRAFWDFPKPLIMAVPGMAVGGGANIALANHADMVLCSENARFMYPFAKLGITPELGSSLLLPWLIGMPKAKEFMMTGRWFSAEEARHLNLVNEVLKPQELLPRAVTLAALVAGHNGTTMRLTKQVMNQPLRAQLDEVLEREQRTITESIGASGGFKKNAKL